MMNIYVGNLPYGLSDAELEQAFAAHGTVTEAKVVVDRATGRSRGFGFVEMPDDSEAEAAIEALNGSEMGGRALVANKARPKR
ncbi:MAG: RNA-binding protein [Phycisphaerae bacterium]|nr:RNA-binding protein [Phycisphaerae bacterium]